MGNTVVMWLVYLSGFTITMAVVKVFMERWDGIGDQEDSVLMWFMAAMNAVMWPFLWAIAILVIPARLLAGKIKGGWWESKKDLQERIRDLERELKL